jgi:hypothetical protein
VEDKILQRAVVEVLNAIYEEDFLGFSYGQHSNDSFAPVSGASWARATTTDQMLGDDAEHAVSR